MHRVLADKLNQICVVITGQKHDMFCLKDLDWEMDFVLLPVHLRDVFEEILPDKCSFEE